MCLPGAGPSRSVSAQLVPVRAVALSDEAWFPMGVITQL
jgi:hypothetical protein